MEIALAITDRSSFKVIATGAETEAASFALPLKSAVTLCSPPVVNGTVHDALAPLITTPLQSSVRPSLNVTVPPAGDGSTDAISVTESPTSGACVEAVRFNREGCSSEF